MSRLDSLLDGSFRILHFADMAQPEQLAIAYFMGVDGEAWEIPFPAVQPLPEHLPRQQIASALKQVLPAVVRRYADECFGYALIDTGRLKRQVLADPEIAKSFDSWGAYAAAYPRDTSPVEHPRTDHWPVILSSTDEETLQDGWHRFHAYCAQGAPHIPAIFFPKPRHFRHLGLPAG